MNTLRIFISSPGDVGEERVIAQRIIKRLQEEFAGRISLAPLFWEHEPLLAVSGFQEQIPLPSETADICVFILWSRLGTPLPENITRPDGSRYASGTEFEFEDAINGYREKRTPDLLVYRKTAERLSSLKNKVEVLERVAQQEAVEAFIKKWFESADGSSFTAAFHPFETPAHFEERLEVHLRKLIENSISTGTDSEHQVRSQALWKESPFRGLQFFDFEHALIFCGRTQAVSDVISVLREQADDGRAFVLVLGMSGIGKSSLIRAGVLPTLTRPRVIEGIDAWRQAIMRPSDASGDLFQGLAIALLRETSLPELAQTETPADELARLFRQTPEAAVTLIKMGLSQVASEAQRQQGTTKQPKAQLALVVDQMEEIFTLERVTSSERKNFIVALSALAHSGCVWVIATMRSDFYGRFVEVPELLHLKQGIGQYDLKPPTPAEISQMIRKPARIAGLRFEEDPNTEVGLDEILRDATVGNPEALPLLQFTLEELYKQCTEQGVLTHGAYQALGGIEGAIGKRAEEEFKKLAVRVQAVFPSVLSSLTSIGLKEESPIRRRVPIDALITTPENNALVKAFVDARLFSTDSADDGTSVVSVAHEALLRCWPRLQAWITENKDFLRTRARIAGAEARWRQEGKHFDHLLPAGKPLAEAKTLLTKRRVDLSIHEIEFIEASIKKNTRNRHLKIGVLSIGSVLTAVIYLAIADAGLNVPKGAKIRTFLDRHETFLFRPVYSEEKIRTAAASLRQSLLKVFQRLRLANGWIPNILKPKTNEDIQVWSHSQSLCALFRMTDAHEIDLRSFLDGLEVVAPFRSTVAIDKIGMEYGWVYGKRENKINAEPGLWTVAAFAAALGRSGLLDKQQKQDLIKRLTYIQEILNIYRPLDTGGWNMFMNQKEPTQHNLYTTTLALLALLEMRKADLPWEGSTERRDTLLKSTAQWLVNYYDDKSDPPGWRQVGVSSNQIFDGLTLQIYSLLLRAESEAGINIPSVILDQIPLHLARCIQRDLSFPVSVGEFSVFYMNPSGHDVLIEESIGFLWYPWAIDCAVRWLQRAEKSNAPKEDIIQVKRVLGHLVVDLGEDSVKKASSDWTFIAAETLYGLSAVSNP